MARRNALTPREATCTSFDGVTIPYTDCGSGPALVFIHGWSCHRGFWREQHALGAAFRVIAMDLAGHGPAAFAASRTAWSMAAFARDVEAVIDAAGVTDAILIGHSMGGAVALEAAVRLGNRCRLVIGVDTFTDDRFYRRRPAAEIAARTAAFAAGFRDAVTEMVARITAPATDLQIVRWIATEMGSTRVDEARAALAALLSWDIEERWPLVGAPVETLNAALLDAPEHAIALAGLRVHALAGVGHFPMLEAPAPFAAVLRAIVARATTRR